MSTRTFIRINERIRAREIRLIDADGNQVGIVSVQEALRQARQRGLDLVEIAANAQPPVCRILNFGKYRYEMAKQEREGRKHQRGTKVKELEFHANIDEHDYQVKMRHAREFLEKDMRVKCSLRFRGREMAHTEFGHEVMKRLIKDLEDIGRVEVTPKLMGKTIVMMFAPGKPPKKTASQPQSQSGAQQPQSSPRQNPQSGAPTPPREQQ